MTTLQFLIGRRSKKMKHS